ncbi:MAG TPA: hypothetical protein VG796_15585 [Verrucomicrobiales bacterium]|nr:hypothetical protein [Verrucomicrobiales bacterium]
MPTSPKKSKRFILLFLGFPLALAGGYGAGLLNQKDDASSGKSAAASRKAAGENAVAAGMSKSKDGKKSTNAGTAFDSQRGWIDRINNAPVSEFGDMWKEIMQISDQYQRRAPRELLYMKWVTLDPAGCMEFLAKNDSGQRVQAMTAWLKHDVDGAYAWALAAGDDVKVNESARMVFQELAKLNPQKFLALAASAKEAHLPGESIQAAFRKFAKTDPAAAVEALRGLGPKARSNGSWGLGIEWARTDPGSAFAWAQQLTDPVDKESALRGVLTSWARTDPDAALSHMDLLQKLPDAKGQDPKSAIVRGLAAKDPQRALDFVIAHAANQNERMNLLANEVIPKLAATMKPAEFAALMDKAGSVTGTADSTGSSYSDALFSRGMYYPGSYPGSGYSPPFPDDADPAGTFRQLTGGKLTPAQKYAATAMAQQWAEKDTSAALAAYQSASDPAIKEMLSSALLNQARSKSDLSLLAMVDAGAGAAGQSRYYADDVIHRQAATDPAKVLAWADDLPGNSQLRGRAQQSALSAWASYDTGSAIAYAGQRPAEEQPQLYAAISGAWAASDTYGSSQWIASLPEGMNRDQAASALITQLSSREPESALAWTRSIGDENLQRSSYVNLFSNWARRDPAGALKAFQAENVPPEQRGMIESIIKQNTRR